MERDPGCVSRYQFAVSLLSVITEHSIVINAPLAHPIVHPSTPSSCALRIWSMTGVFGFHHFFLFSSLCACRSWFCSDPPRVHRARYCSADGVGARRAGEPGSSSSSRGAPGPAPNFVAIPVRLQIRVLTIRCSKSTHGSRIRVRGERMRG